MALPDLFRISEHALLEMARRDIDASALWAVISEPEQIVPIRPGRSVYQSRIESGTRLLRVVVDVDRQPAIVVTAYRTSNLRKYWQTEA